VCTSGYRQATTKVPEHPDSGRLNVRPNTGE